MTITCNTTVTRYNIMRSISLAIYHSPHYSLKFPRERLILHCSIPCNKCIPVLAYALYTAESAIHCKRNNT